VALEAQVEDPGELSLEEILQQLSPVGRIEWEKAQLSAAVVKRDRVIAQQSQLIDILKEQNNGG
jgi:hypothetical protein